MNIIGAERPRQEVLDAFAVTAVQKVKEFADYWAILADTAADGAFRLQAARMVKSLFISDTVLVDLPDIHGTKEFRRPLADWIRMTLHDGITTQAFMIDTAIIEQPAAPVGDSLYVGVLRIRAKERITSEQPAKLYSYNCSFVITRTPHILYGRREMLWSTSLGEFYRQ